MKKNDRKLALTKTTVRTITATDLNAAVGGFYTTETLYSCHGGTCSRGPTLCGG